MCKYFQFTQENQGREVPEENCGLLKVHHRKNPSRIQLENELGNSTILEHNYILLEHNGVMDTKGKAFWSWWKSLE